MCNSELYTQFLFVTWKGYRVQVPESFIPLKLQIWQDVWRVSNKHFMCSPPFQLHIWKLIHWHKICCMNHCKFSDLTWGSLFMPNPPGLFICLFNALLRSVCLWWMGLCGFYLNPTMFLTYILPHAHFLIPCVFCMNFSCYSNILKLLQQVTLHVPFITNGHTPQVTKASCEYLTARLP